MPNSVPVHPAYDRKKEPLVPWKLDGSSLVGDAPDPLDPPAAPEVQTEPEPEYPGGYTVVEVQEYVEANPDEAQRMLELETADRDRVTLTSWLSDFIAARA